MPVLRDEIRQLGSWFHNLRLEDEQTAPEHPLGDFPAVFWQQFQHALPADLTAKSVLDIGCNGGFYSFEMKRRGASRILAVDHDPVYLAQARFARDRLGYTDADIELRELDVYDLDQIHEQFDLVLFLGVLYHLRHPLYALEKVANLVAPGGTLVYQAMERGSTTITPLEENYPFSEQDIFMEDGYPRLHFVENRFANDPTNWWIPNAAANEAMLRSCGLTILDRPSHEVYVCRRNTSAQG